MVPMGQKPSLANWVLGQGYLKVMVKAVAGGALTGRPWEESTSRVFQLLAEFSSLCLQD